MNDGQPQRSPRTDLRILPERRWLLRLMQLQFDSNCLSSVSIEVPALRPRADALRRALGGYEGGERASEPVGGERETTGGDRTPWHSHLNDDDLAVMEMDRDA